MSISIDIGCGTKCLPGFTGMDNKDLSGVDVVHDLEDIPWPFESESVYAIHASHVLEHMKPWKIFDIMNEAWRVCEFGGGIDIKVPYGFAYSIDPSHTILFNIASFYYFQPSTEFYKIYTPKPWKCNYQIADQKTQEIRVILEKIKA